MCFNSFFFFSPVLQIFLYLLLAQPWIWLFLSFISLYVFLFYPEEILERLRAKKEEELEEVKRRAAEEALKAQMEKEKREVDVEKGDEDVKLKDEGQQEAKIKEAAKEEGEQRTKEEEATKKKVDGAKAGGNYVS